MYARSYFTTPRWGWTSPFAEVDRMRRQMEAMSERLFHGFPLRQFAGPGVFPAVNITETPEHYIVRAELPGLKAEDLDIQVVGKSLAIKGERKIPMEGENVRYHRREREAGQFSRIIGLPGDIDPGKVEAAIVNGLLTVRIPKAEAAKPKRITVN